MPILRATSTISPEADNFSVGRRSHAKTEVGLNRGGRIAHSNTTCPRTKTTHGTP